MATHPAKYTDSFIPIFAKLLMDCKTVLDPFMGTGTTAVACKKMGIDYIGSELSQNQVQYALKRIKEETAQLSLF